MRERLDEIVGRKAQLRGQLILQGVNLKRRRYGIEFLRIENIVHNSPRRACYMIAEIWIQLYILAILCQRRLLLCEWETGGTYLSYLCSAKKNCGGVPLQI